MKHMETQFKTKVAFYRYNKIATYTFEATFGEVASITVLLYWFYGYVFRDIGCNTAALKKINIVCVFRGKLV